MTPLRELKNIAHGLAGTFISRNNDVAGYWAIGMLYRECLAAACTTVEFDLIAGYCLPDGSVARAVIPRHADWLAARLKGRPIASARILLQFGSLGGFAPPLQASYGDPFACVVILTTAEGRECGVIRTGRCAPHSAGEQRSARSDMRHDVAAAAPRDAD